MYLPDCPTCHGEGCPDCGDSGTLNRWRKCTAEEARSAIQAAGGCGKMVPLFSSEWQRLDEPRSSESRTTWGRLDGTPVVHHECRNDNPRALRGTDTHECWRWET